MSARHLRGRGERPYDWPPAGQPLLAPLAWWEAVLGGLFFATCILIVFWEVQIVAWLLGVDG